MFGDKARAINNIARETREASRRETFATEQNTRAVRELAEITERLPTDIGDNMPKYSEREVRALKKEIEQLRQQATVAHMINNEIGVVLCPIMENMSYEFRLMFRNVSLDIQDVSYGENFIQAKILPKQWETRAELHKAMRY